MSFRHVLVYVASGLCVILALMGFTVILLSRQRSSTSFTADTGITRCQGIPCFRDIIPGQTSWDEAIAVLGQATTVTDPLYLRISLMPSPDHKTVDYILLDRPLNSQVTLGELTLRFGAASCITRYQTQQSTTIAMHYDGLDVLTTTHTRYLGPEDQIISIVVGYPTPKEDCVEETDPVIARWGMNMFSPQIPLEDVYARP